MQYRTIIDKLKDILNARVVGISCGEIVQHLLLYNHIETPVVPLFFAIAALEKEIYEPKKNWAEIKLILKEIAKILATTAVTIATVKAIIATGLVSASVFVITEAVELVLHLAIKLYKYKKKTPQSPLEEEEQNDLIVPAPAPVPAPARGLVPVLDSAVLPARDTSTTVVTTADNRIHLAILFVLAVLLQIIWIQPTQPTESNELTSTQMEESSTNIVVVYLFMINSGDREPPDLAIKLIFG